MSVLNDKLLYFVQQSAEESINRDRTARKRAILVGNNVVTKPKWGFFGTIFHLILEVNLHFFYLNT